MIILKIILVPFILAAAVTFLFGIDAVMKKLNEDGNFKIWQQAAYVIICVIGVVGFVLFIAGIL